MTLFSFINMIVDVQVDEFLFNSIKDRDVEDFAVALKDFQGSTAGRPIPFQQDC